MKFSNAKRTSIQVLPVMASALILGLMVACANNNDNNSAPVKNNPAGNKATGGSEDDLVKASFSKDEFDPSLDANQKFGERVLGASAIVTPIDNPADPKAKKFNAKIAILLAGQDSKEAAVKMFFVGDIFPGMEKDAKTTDGVGGTKLRIPLKTTKLDSDASSQTGTDRFVAETICKADDCSKIQVRLVELLTVPPEEKVMDYSKRLNQVVMTFKRKAKAQIGDELEFIYISSEVIRQAVDPKTGKPVAGKVTSVKGNPRVGFDDAMKSLKEGEVVPSKKDLPAVDPTKDPAKDPTKDPAKDQPAPEAASAPAAPAGAAPAAPPAPAAPEAAPAPAAPAPEAAPAPAPEQTK